MAKVTSRKPAPTESPSDKEGAPEESPVNRYGLREPGGGEATVTLRMNLKTKDVKVDVQGSEHLRPDLVKEGLRVVQDTVRTILTKQRLEGRRIMNPQVTSDKERSPQRGKKALTPAEHQERSAISRAQQSSVTPPKKDELNRRKETFEDVKQMEQSVVENLQSRGS